MFLGGSKGTGMSQGSYSANQDKDEYGQPGGYGGQHSGGYSEAAPSQYGMTTQPSVGRFTEKDRGNVSMFSRKPSTPVLPPPNNSMLSQDSSQSSSGGIVNLRAAPRAEGKMNKNAAKKKK